MYRDGARKSIWQEEIKRFSSTTDLNQPFDIAIIGGGFTGVSTALKLQQSGKKCILIEASNIGFGTTGGTTAHLNDFFDTTYAQAISDFGLDQAKLLAEAGKDAMRIIESNVSQFNIPCDFEKKTAYLFALDEKQAKQLDDMVEAILK
ncbi:FAD-dependent oxidoreductase, partial [Chryseobacterium sp. Alg-005]|uniref:FAD-dependent oxidoreductase n=1 Tax=Chryseobacterium sp. Alg-005 TaxID=3159516 RepID=UPI0036F31613